MRFTPEDMDYLLDRAGINRETQVRRVMVRRYVDGYTDIAIAAELGITAGRVRAYASDGWVRIREEPVIDLDALLSVIVAELREQDQDPDLLSVREHARQLLTVMRGETPTDPVTPVLDERGRRVGVPATVVNLDDAVRIVRSVPDRRRIRPAPSQWAKDGPEAGSDTNRTKENLACEEK